ncbi:hypothetical protein FAIPA1_160068 [Frankia sp. AiPs1]
MVPLNRTPAPEAVTHSDNPPNPVLLGSVSARLGRLAPCGRDPTLAWSVRVRQGLCGAGLSWLAPSGAALLGPACLRLCPARTVAA